MSLKRLAIVISHPIQYFAPLYRRLGARDDVVIKVFFTWHAGEAAMRDSGFQRVFAWDIPLTEGYDFERVPNSARDPGPHHFRGLRNPSLVDRVMDWRPDAVLVTGWAWEANLKALRGFHRRGVPVLFRGDSHLLDGGGNVFRAWLKSAGLRVIYSWPDAFLYAGSANRAYFEYYGVPAEKLFFCPHSIDVGRFTEPDAELEQKAAEWRQALNIAPHQSVVLFAGKFEDKKQPLQLMDVFARLEGDNHILVMVGNGELETAVAARVAADPGRFRLLPFQNQSRMPLVYRLADLFVLPSLYGESWGLAVNEAMASGRPVLVSDRVGCAADLVDSSSGAVFKAGDPSALGQKLHRLLASREKLQEMRTAARQKAASFDIGIAEAAIIAGLKRILGP